MRRRLSNTISRRAFNAFLLTPAVGAFEPERQIPAALQLFSVRHECEKDFPGTLAAISQAGYKGVEFAGFYDWRAGDLRQLLKEVSLLPAGSHTPLDKLIGTDFKETVDFNRTIGNRNVIVPGVPPEYQSPEGWLKAAALLNDISARLEPLGMRVGYHNHAVEFDSAGHQRPWDTLVNATRPAVTMQLDTGNARVAGADPIEILRHCPGRARSVHLKDYLPGHPDVLLGSSSFDWPALFRVCRSVAGTEWYIIEHESHERPAMEAAKESLKRLKKLSATG